MRKLLVFTVILAVLTCGLYAKETEKNLPGEQTIEQIMAPIHWLHHSSFRIETGGKIIYIDPYKIIGTVPADYIFITHEHPDHLSPADIKKIAGKNTLIICSPQCAPELKGYNIKVVRPGDVFEVGGIKCEAVAAYNNWKPFHQKKDQKVGYILEINGSRIYHAGDTDFIEEMKSLKNITVAMVPVGGFFTMDPAEAAKAINVIKPRIAVPIHYGMIMGTKNNSDIFKKLVEPPVFVDIMKEEEPK